MKKGFINIFNIGWAKYKSFEDKNLIFELYNDFIKRTE